jgi:hypothetical protein
MPSPESDYLQTAQSSSARRLGICNKTNPGSDFVIVCGFKGSGSAALSTNNSIFTTSTTNKTL